MFGQGMSILPIHQVRIYEARLVVHKQNPTTMRTCSRACSGLYETCVKGREKHGVTQLLMIEARWHSVTLTNLHLTTMHARKSIHIALLMRSRGVNPQSVFNIIPDWVAVKAVELSHQNKDSYLQYTLVWQLNLHSITASQLAVTFHLCLGSFLSVRKIGDVWNSLPSPPLPKHIVPRK